jgi:hypothetical protein
MFIKHTIRPAFNALEERKNQLAEKAAALGLTFGTSGMGYGKNAFGGNTFGVKDVLKAHGARFDGQSKVWYFESLEAAEAAIAAL